MATEDTKLFTVTGEKAFIARIKAMEEMIETEAVVAIEEAANTITIPMMKRLVGKDTHALEKSIRFTWGRFGGQLKTSGKPRSRKGRQTRVIGYIVAGDETTLVGGGTPSATFKNKGSTKIHTRKGRSAQKWQNARLQEFGTRKMPQHPFFYPSWRATRPAFKKKMIQVLRLAMKAARRTGEQERAA
jgi:HK97 gp10 family phage protein